MVCSPEFAAGSRRVRAGKRGERRDRKGIDVYAVRVEMENSDDFVSIAARMVTLPANVR